MGRWRMSNYYSMYSVPFGNNPYVQYGTYAGSKIPQVMDENNEATLGETIVGGGLVMGGIQMGPKLMHPIESYTAMRGADKIYLELLKSESFKNLPEAEKAKIYKQLFEKEKYASRILNVRNSLRGESVSKEIIKMLDDATSKYTEAIKKGDMVAAEKYAAEMRTIAKKGVEQGFFARMFTKGKTSKIYTPEEIKAFTEAEKAAKAAKAAEATAGAAKAAEASAGAANAAKASAGAAKAVGSFSLMNTAKDALKSGGFKGMAAIEGVIETFTEVIPAFQLGTDKGIKQVGKSAVTVAGSAAGWCAGAYVGGAVGAKVGAAVGTAICPGVGTAVGAAIGLVGGLIGSWLGHKAAKAVVGKSEVEKAQEQAQEQAQTQPAPQQTMPTIPDNTQVPPNFYTFPSQVTPTNSYTQPSFDFSTPTSNYTLPGFDFSSLTSNYTLPGFDFSSLISTPTAYMTNPFATSQFGGGAIDNLFLSRPDSMSLYA